MGDIGLREIVSVKLFQSMCILLVILMSYHLLLQYLKNEDSSSVSFRKFNGDKRDIYPSFSICMHSVKGATLKKYPEIYGLNGSDGIEIYRKMLKGRQNLSMEFKTFNFENNSIDILSEFVDMFVSYSKQGQQISVWNRKQYKNTESPFYKSYQDPYFSCITKSVSFVENQILHYDYLVLNAVGFLRYIRNAPRHDNTTNLFFYVHHPGQLLREFGKQTFQLNLLDFENAINNTNNYREIHISQVDVVRKREGGIIPCHDGIGDEDQQWLNSVINDVECVPTYWRDIHHSSSSVHCKIPDCNSSELYENLHEQYLPPNNFDTGANLYDSPCNQMRTTLNYLQKDLSTADSVLVLAISYNTEEYREVLNHRAMGKSSLYLDFMKVLWSIIYLEKQNVSRNHIAYLALYILLAYLLVYCASDVILRHYLISDII